MYVQTYDLSEAALRSHMVAATVHIHSSPWKLYLALLAENKIQKVHTFQLSFEMYGPMGGLNIS